MLAMPSKLILDPAEPGVNEVMTGMAVGQPTVLRELTVVPTVITQDSLEADITAVSLEQGGEGEAEPVPAGAPGGAPAYEKLTSMPRENEGGFDQGQL